MIREAHNHIIEQCKWLLDNPQSADSVLAQFLFCNLIKELMRTGPLQEDLNLGGLTKTLLTPDNTPIRIGRALLSQNNNQELFWMGDANRVELNGIKCHRSGEVILYYPYRKIEWQSTLGLTRYETIISTEPYSKEKLLDMINLTLNSHVTELSH